MRYKHLPAVGELSLPELPYKSSPNRSSRNGRRARLVFAHRWGNLDSDFADNVAYLRKPSADASAHIVYAGELGRHAGKAAQLVPFAEKAWTECELNPIGLSVEFADAIFLGHDPEGFARGARIIAALCHFELDACRYVDANGIVRGSHGFTRHRDGGALGCSHPSCPTADAELWQQFANRVVGEYRHGGFRKEWGR